MTLDPILKLAVLKRDRNHCIECGNDLRLEVHHIIPVKHGGEDLLENLTTLCKSCHKRLEPKRRFRVPNSNYLNQFSTIRIHGKTYEFLAKNVKYPESIAETLDRLLGLSDSKYHNA